MVQATRSSQQRVDQDMAWVNFTVAEVLLPNFLIFLQAMYLTVDSERKTVDCKDWTLLCV